MILRCLDSLTFLGRSVSIEVSLLSIPLLVFMLLLLLLLLLLPRPWPGPGPCQELIDPKPGPFCTFSGFAAEAGGVRMEPSGPYVSPKTSCSYTVARNSTTSGSIPSDHASCSNNGTDQV